MPATEAVITAPGRNLFNSHLLLPCVIPCPAGLIAPHEKKELAGSWASRHPSQAEGAHLAESIARPKGPAFFVHQCLQGLSPGGCSVLLSLCPAEARSVLYCLGLAIRGCRCPRSAVAPTPATMLQVSAVPMAEPILHSCQGEAKALPGQLQKAAQLYLPNLGCLNFQHRQVEACRFAPAFHNESPQTICLHCF